MDQKGPNAQKLLKFNSPNDKLSNDTPHEYGTLKYKIPVFKGYKGPIRAPVGDQKGSNAQKLYFSTRLLISFRMMPHMPIVLAKTKFGFWGPY